MKVLVIQQKMIGDVLTSTILLEALRHKYPNAQLDYLINEHTLPVVLNNPYINNTLIFTKEAESSKKALFKLATSIRHTKYDVVIDVYSKFSSNFITFYSTAKTRISKYKWYTSFIYTHSFKEHKIPNTNAGLAIENRMQLLKPIYPDDIAAIKPKIYLTQSEIDAAKDKLTQYNVNLSQPLFMISALGSSDKKTYPLRYMAQLIDLIVSKTKGYILLNYIPKQKGDIEKLYSYCSVETKKHIHLDVYGKSLREFIAISYHCNAIIGNEGGAINMAKAIEKPTFAIFSPWIKKDAWSMFDDGEKNDSMHLKDVKPNLYNNKKLSVIKQEFNTFYNEFSPDLIRPKLNTFLKNNL